MTKEKDFSNVIDPWLDYEDLIEIQFSRHGTLSNYKKDLFSV
jgi:hypothetical protein